MKNNTNNKKHLKFARYIAKDMAAEEDKEERYRLLGWFQAEIASIQW